MDGGRIAVSSRAAWSTGQLSAGSGGPRLLFGQMFEDPRIELDAFTGKRRVFCIASAGCTAMALSREHPEVVACDINPAQLAYARSRAASGGSVAAGAVDRVLAFARRGGPLAGWTPAQVNEFLSHGDLSGQLADWRAHLDTWRFRTAFDALLSRPVLRLVYAQQLLGFLPPRFGLVVRARLERGFSLHPNATNPYARLLLRGDPVPAAECRPGRIEWVAADAAAYLEQCPARSFDGFTLSNILDGAEPVYAARLERAIRHAAAPGAVAVVRSFSEGTQCACTGENLAARDRALLWGSLTVLRF